MTRKSGFNLIEIAIVMAVIGLVVAGIWTAAANVRERRDLTRTIEQVIMIKEGFKGLYASKSLGMGCASWGSCPMSEVGIKAGIVPNDMQVYYLSGGQNVTDYNQLRSTWGGGVFLQFGRWITTFPNGYDGIFINFDPVSRSMCTKMAMAMIVGRDDVLYYSIDKATGVSPPPFGSGPALTNTTAATMCNSVSPTAFQVLYKLN